MTSNIPPEVLEYIELVENEVHRTCEEQKALVKHIRKCFETENLHVDVEQLHNYLKLVKYFPYGDLLPWQKFLIALWNCTYTDDGDPRWDTLLCIVGRGAGKDGFIGFISFCSVSPYNPVAKYNVDICANNEDQAVTPVKDVAEVLENPAFETKLKKHFYHTKEVVQGRKNGGVIKGRTNNPKGRDGMRSGMVVFNEVHQYENYDNITVFITGQGKVPQPRMGVFSSNGEVNDGPLDDYLNTGRRILFEGEADDGTLPFFCLLPNESEVHDPENWYKANPSLYYFPHLKKEIEKEYKKWKKNPEENSSFLIKRMGIRKGVKDITVTDYEKIKATNKPLPDLTGWSCTVGIDYAELSDWAGVNFHFRKGNERFDINHAWICLQSKTLPRVHAPWQAWAEQGHATLIDDVSIPPEVIAEYIAMMGRKYHIKALAMDNFRWALMADALKKIGFDANDKNRVRLIRTSDIMKIEPVIQESFDREYFCWGDNPVLRWAVNNTKRVRSSKKIGSDTGNFYYAKIEAKSRKTDPWMALVASMAIEDKLGSGIPLSAPKMGAIAF